MGTIIRIGRFIRRTSKTINDRKLLVRNATVLSRRHRLLFTIVISYTGLENFNTYSFVSRRCIVRDIIGAIHRPRCTGQLVISVFSVVAVWILFSLWNKLVWVQKQLRVKRQTLARRSLGPWLMYTEYHLRFVRFFSLKYKGKTTTTNNARGRVIRGDRD